MYKRQPNTKTIQRMLTMDMVNSMKCAFMLWLCIGMVQHLHAETEQPFLSEDQEALPGCAIPDLRFLRPRKIVATTTDQSVVPDETTEMPDDSSTVDVEKLDESVISEGSDVRAVNQRQTRYTDYNPYAWNSESADETDANQQRVTIKSERRKSRKNAAQQRRTEGSAGEHKVAKREIIGLFDDGTLWINGIENIRKHHGFAKRHNRSEQHRMQKHSRKASGGDGDGGDDGIGGGGGDTVQYVDGNGTAHKIRSNSTKGQHTRRTRKHSSARTNREHRHRQQQQQQLHEQHQDEIDLQSAHSTDDVVANGGAVAAPNVSLSEWKVTVNGLPLNGTIAYENDTESLYRVKRKSGKATGALRPKGSGDSGSKSTSRKKDAGYDEEGAYVPPVDEEDDDEEFEEEIDESIHFDEATEIRFSGEVGPIGDLRTCKLRCVKGKWVGPLCASSDEDEVKYQPLYKSCSVTRIPPHLLLSYKNISMNVGWDVPHGHSLQARCKDLGLYKLLGETRVLCSNGLWAPRMPSCVPTTLLTNFSDDSPPSIRIKILSGSGTFEPSGVLAVLPGTTVYLDCMYPKKKGSPDWTWTGWHRTYQTTWINSPDGRATKFRLIIKDIQQQESGTYICTSPRGLTNSIGIIVTMSTCPEPQTPTPPLALRLEGTKLGQRALYSCPVGFSIDGISNSTCLASGNWSSPAPVCNPVQCPSLPLEDPHLTLTELNTSAWGKAVFKCSWGYRLSGPANLSCQSDGTWNAAVPRCKAIQCAQPLVPINGRIEGTSQLANHRKYTVGALVSFACNEGHSLIGEASIVCTETGFWSHPPPFCKSQCPYPGDPPNGLIAPLKFHYDAGDFLTVQCRTGFVEHTIDGAPPERPKCLPDGTWSASVPQCKFFELV